MKSNITKYQSEKNASEKNLIELRSKEQELISTSGTSVSQLTEFDDKLTKRRTSRDEITGHINKLTIELEGLKRDLTEIKTEESSLKKTIKRIRV